MNSINFYIFILLIKFINTQYIDLSEMSDPRILSNRYRFSSESMNDNVMKVGGERVIYREIVYQKNNQYNEINNELEIATKEFKTSDSSINEYILDKKSKNNELEVPVRECKISDKSINNECILNQETIQYNKLKEDFKKKDVDEAKMFNKCIKDNKQLTEELVCYRNLKIIYSRYRTKINELITRIKLEKLKLEIHPYSNELFILDGVFKTENCLIAVDNLEKVISRLDHLVSRIEPIDLTKEIIYASIVLVISFCFYYVYRYMNVKYIFMATFGFLFYLHEYYNLIITKRAEIQYQLRKLNDCHQQGLVTNFFSFLFKNFYSSWSFKGDGCDINEDLLYIDAIFKINPLEPIFTIIPKLFSKSFVIIFENFGKAFYLFSSKIPILHVYPFLLITICLLVYLIKMFYDFLIANRKLNYDFKLNLAKITTNTNNLMLEENISLNLNNSPIGNNLNNSPIGNNLNDPIGNNLNNNNPINNPIKNSSNNKRFKNTKVRKLIRTTSLDFIPCF